MYKRFNADINELYSNLYLQNYNDSTYDGSFNTSLDDFTKNIKCAYGKEINVDNIVDEWFPKVKADVFLSHSHKDKEKVIQFANYLYEKFHITAFIDSEVWKYMNDLLDQLNNEYCMTDDHKYYWYKNTLYTSENIHTILTASLMKMIDETECVIFLNSNNTTVNMAQNKETNSPWIYIELMINNIMRKQEPGRNRIDEGEVKKAAILEEAAMDSKPPVFSFDTTPLLDSFKKLNSSHFKYWESEYQKNEHQIKAPAMSLDILYKIANSKRLTFNAEFPQIG